MDFKIKKKLFKAYYYFTEKEGLVWKAIPCVVTAVTERIKGEKIIRVSPVIGVSAGDEYPENDSFWDPFFETENEAIEHAKILAFELLDHLIIEQKNLIKDTEKTLEELIDIKEKRGL